MRIRTWAFLVSVAAIGASASAARAAYPDKPIQIVVPYSPGGSTDLIARAFAQVAPRFFPQPLVIVNKAGGGAIPGRMDVARSKPDGYTLLFGYGGGEDTIVPWQRQLPYDVLKDFDVVCRLSIHSVVVVVPGASPIRSVADVVKVGKERTLTAAVSTKGATADITFQLLAQRAGIRITSVPGAGGSDAMTRLVGGHADLGAGQPSEMMSHLKAGRLRAIAVALDHRDPVLPEVPTFREQGYDVTSVGSVKGIAVAKDTPKEILSYLDGKCRDVSRDAEFAGIMKQIAQPIDYLPSAEYAAWFKKAYDEQGPLLKMLHIETK